MFDQINSKGETKYMLDFEMLTLLQEGIVEELEVDFKCKDTERRNIPESAAHSGKRLSAGGTYIR